MVTVGRFIRSKYLTKIYGSNAPTKAISVTQYIQKTSSVFILLIGICFTLSVAASTKGEAPPKATVSDPESLVVQALSAIGRSDLKRAQISIDKALSINPNFQLAQLIKGDLLLARAQPITNVGNALNAPPQKIEDLRAEAKARVARQNHQPPAGTIPKYLVQLPTDQKYIVVVDTNQSTLYLFENKNGEAKYVRDYYISHGRNGAVKSKEGDQRTPLGVYFVTSSIPKNKLSDFYGAGAYPISYPNEWDRRNGFNGHGIWLHGTPSNTYSRAPKASNGCVVLSNEDLSALGLTLQVGITPVIIAEKIQWAKPSEVTIIRSEIQKQVEGWRRAWESRSVEDYMGYYGDRFAASGMTKASWGAQKKQVNTAKSWIKVNLKNMSIFTYPTQPNLAVVSFEQVYTSSNLSNEMRKRQYWWKDGKHWKIIYEGSA